MPYLPYPALGSDTARPDLEDEDEDDEDDDRSDDFVFLESAIDGSPSRSRRRSLEEVEVSACPRDCLVETHGIQN